MLLLNSHILSGFLPKIVYLPLITPFSTDSNIKLFFSTKKLLIKLVIIVSFFTSIDEYIIYDLQGKVVRKELVNDSQFKIQIGILQAGLYILEVSGENGNLKQQLVVQ